MNENYEDYKKNLSRDQKKHNDLLDGKILLVAGICLLLYLAYILPFHADNAGEICGNEMKSGSTYDHVQVYYIEHLQLLRAKTGADDDEIYCIAKFLDRDQNEWIISFTPGENERIVQDIKLADQFNKELSSTVSGYFQLKPLEDLPYAADSFFTVYGSKYADAEGSNMLSMNAEYLCEKNDNYTLKVLLRPGTPLITLVVGLFGTIAGPILLFKNRNRKAI
ncbi:MAG: hypothetical protein HDQ98_13355 [Lachnospiraceae bacterium]|nr:hypothetical protein [Lachnospiraceae bacterium]